MTLEHLKREAKRWLKALRANVATARARLERALPNAPAEPSLRDVQHALARERGLAGWTGLKNQLAGVPRTDRNQPDPVARFLEYACPDHHIRGGPAHLMARHAAMRLLRRHPEIARSSLYTAVACGDLEEVERVLAERPQAASERSSAPGPDRAGVGGAGDLFRDVGPKRWEPLLYLCFTRLPLPAVSDNAVAIARALLDRGADPNAYFMAGDSRYTPLVGVIGEGEEDRPPHPQRDALTQLLLERGAEPYDIQVIYNTHFHGDVLWFLKLIHAQAVQLGRQADWADPDWSMLDMGGYGSGARWLLEAAVRNNDLELADWMLAHGASPNAAPARDPRFSKLTLHEQALRHGFTDMADLLLRYGATPSVVAPQGEEAFAAACLRLDRTTVQALLAEHPEYLRSTVALFAAAQRDRADVVALLLDLGMSPDVEDQKQQRPLHVAAYNDSVRVAALLIERGAEIDPVESNYNNTPLDCAVYAQKPRMVELLSPLSRDVWNLTFTGHAERLRQVLREAPDRATVVSSEYGTPLFWLPDDEARAMEIAGLLLAHGADPSARNKEGQTAAFRARRRGLDEVADLLTVAAGSSAPRTPPATPSPEHYERLAEAFLAAYRTGEAGAMRRVWAAAGHMRSWEALRTYMQLDLGKRPDAEHPEADISIADARLLVARGHGFESWQALTEYVATLPAGKAIAARPVRLFSTDEQGAEHAAGSAGDWDTIISLMQARRIPGLDAAGQMTDAMLERVSRLDHVTTLQLASSAQVTDAGLQHLARMPQLRHLDLTGCDVSDRGLEVLRHLPDLRTFKLVHHAGVSDAGVAHLAHCRHLEAVDLMGTGTGDGAIKALIGMPRLHHFQAGSLVTDAGLTHLHEFPVFRTWQGGEIRMQITSPDAGPNFLWLNLRSPLTNRGLANLEGLDGLFALSLFGISGMPSFEDRDSGITAAGLKHLVELPHLEWLGCTAGLCTDEAMRLIGTMPRVRMLMCQDTIAGDDGFVALSHSQSIERIWGRCCYNLRSRGFAALAAMPALRSLSVSCKNVDDAGLAALPRFPALTELMPMDVPDDGYRHVGRCERLESLILMYCRDTTDVATAHIAGLSRLKKYFASYTRITDRSLEILGRMPSIEHIEFYGCPGVTNVGVAALAALPRLREIHISGPQLTGECVAVFPAHVRVNFST